MSSLSAVVIFRETKCGLRCLFCENSSPSNTTARSASRRTEFFEMLSALPDLAPRKGEPRSGSECILSGQEPLDSPNFLKAAAEIRKRGYAHIRLNTTGIRLANAATVKTLARIGVDGVDLPIYGSRAEVHDLITGTPGSFALLMKAISNIRRRPGIRISLLHTLILKQNIADLPEICSFVRRNVDVQPLEIRLPYGTTAGELRNLPAVCPSFSEVRGILEEIPPGPYRMSGLPPCICPAHLKWPGGADSPGNPHAGTSARKPWPAAPWTLPQDERSLSPGYHYAVSCRGCAMKSGCPGVHESHLSLHGDKELSPARALRGLRAGRGGRQDFPAAIARYGKAAAQGDLDAQTNIGTVYYDRRDYGKALMWFLRAAQAGNAAAQFNAGNLYYNGDGVTRDYAAAARWYRKAGENGDARAQNNLGFMYANGQGVAKDEAQSLVWYKKAAERGNSAARTALASLGKSGRAAPRD